MGTLLGFSTGDYICDKNSNVDLLSTVLERPLKLVGPKRDAKTILKWGRLRSGRRSLRQRQPQATPEVRLALPRSVAVVVATIVHNPLSISQTQPPRALYQNEIAFLEVSNALLFLAKVLQKSALDKYIFSRDLSQRCHFHIYCKVFDLWIIKVEWRGAFFTRLLKTKVWVFSGFFTESNGSYRRTNLGNTIST